MRVPRALPERLTDLSARPTSLPRDHPLRGTIFYYYTALRRQGVRTRLKWTLHKLTRRAALRNQRRSEVRNGVAGGYFSGCEMISS